MDHDRDRSSKQNEDDLGKNEHYQSKTSKGGYASVKERVKRYESESNQRASVSVLNTVECVYFRPKPSANWTDSRILSLSSRPCPSISTSGTENNKNTNVVLEDAGGENGAGSSIEGKETTETEAEKRTQAETNAQAEDGCTENGQNENGSPANRGKDARSQDAEEDGQRAMKSNFEDRGGSNWAWSTLDEGVNQKASCSPNSSFQMIPTEVEKLELNIEEFYQEKVKDLISFGRHSNALEKLGSVFQYLKTVESKNDDLQVELKAIERDSRELYRKHFAENQEVAPVEALADILKAIFKYVEENKVRSRYSKSVSSYEEMEEQCRQMFKKKFPKTEKYVSGRSSFDLLSVISNRYIEIKNNNKDLQAKVAEYEKMVEDCREMYKREFPTSNSSSDESSNPRTLLKQASDICAQIRSKNIELDKRIIGYEIVEHSCQKFYCERLLRPATINSKDTSVTLYTATEQMRKIILALQNQITQQQSEIESADVFRESSTNELRKNEELLKEQESKVASLQKKLEENQNQLKTVTNAHEEKAVNQAKLLSDEKSKHRTLKDIEESCRKLYRDKLPESVTSNSDQNSFEILSATFSRLENITRQNQELEKQISAYKAAEKDCQNDYASKILNRPSYECDQTLQPFSSVVEMMKEAALKLVDYKLQVESLEKCNEINSEMWKTDKDTLDKQETEIKSLGNQLKDARKNLEETTKTFSEKAVGQAKILSERDLKCKKLQNELDSASNLLKTSTEQNKMLILNGQQLNNKLMKSNNKLEEANEQLNEQRNLTERLEREKKAFQDQYNELKNVIDTKEESLRKAEELIRKLNSTFSSLLKSISAERLKTELDALSGSVQSHCVIRTEEDVKKEANRAFIQKSVDKIRKIHDNMRRYEPQIDSFSGGPESRTYLNVREMLTRGITKLDDVDSNGVEEIKATRKKAILYVQKLQEMLQRKVKRR